MRENKLNPANIVRITVQAKSKNESGYYYVNRGTTIGMARITGFQRHEGIIQVLGCHENDWKRAHPTDEKITEDEINKRIYDVSFVIATVPLAKNPIIDYYPIERGKE